MNSSNIEQLVCQISLRPGEEDKKKGRCLFWQGD